jgi:hypothetical protein
MKTQPTFSLAQKLWDYPEQVLQVVDPAHPLFRFGGEGLIRRVGSRDTPR